MKKTILLAIILMWCGTAWGITIEDFTLGDEQSKDTNQYSHTTLVRLASNKILLAWRSGYNTGTGYVYAVAGTVNTDKTVTFGNIATIYNSENVKSCTASLIHADASNPEVCICWNLDSADYEEGRCEIISVDVSTLAITTGTEKVFDYGVERVGSTQITTDRVGLIYYSDYDEEYASVDYVMGTVAVRSGARTLADFNKETCTTCNPVADYPYGSEIDTSLSGGLDQRPNIICVDEADERCIFIYNQAGEDDGYLKGALASGDSFNAPGNAVVIDSGNNCTRPSGCKIGENRFFITWTRGSASYHVGSIRGFIGSTTDADPPVITANSAQEIRSAYGTWLSSKEISEDLVAFSYMYDEDIDETIGDAGFVELIQMNDDNSFTLLTDTRTSLYTCSASNTYAKFEHIARLKDTSFAITYSADTHSAGDNYYGKIVIADYNITSGLKFYDDSDSEWRYYDTLAEMEAIETPAQGDIIDGQYNTFTESWAATASGAVGDPITYRYAIINGEGAAATTISLNGYDNLTWDGTIAYGYSTQQLATGKTATGEEFKNCIFIGGSTMTASGIFTGGFYNCVFSGGETGVNITASSPEIYNCIFYNNTTSDITSTTGTATGDGNIFQESAANLSGDYADDGGSDGSTYEASDADIGFADAANKNYRLTSDSTVKDSGSFIAGTPYSSAVTDAYGRPVTNSDGTAIGYASPGVYVYMDDITDYAGRTVIEDGVVVNDMPIGAYLFAGSGGGLGLGLGLGL